MWFIKLNPFQIEKTRALLDEEVEVENLLTRHNGKHESVIVETSAKTGQNVNKVREEELFLLCTGQIIL